MNGFFSRRCNTSRSEVPPSVLVVGQGPPTRGGIPTFVTDITGDAWLGRRLSLRFLNTTPRGTKRPGSLHASNLGFALRDAGRVFIGAVRSDIVHLNLAAAPTLPLLRAAFLSTVAKAGGAKVVLHAHTGRLPESMQSRTYRAVMMALLVVIDRLIVVSRSAESALSAAGRRIVRLENGIDFGRVQTGPKALDPPLLAFVGTVCERKGLMDLREALEILVEDFGRLPVRVVVMGDARQEGPGVFERVRRSFDEAGLAAVEFAGVIEPLKVTGILSEASIFCLPSHWEGFPLSILEAMSAGAAVVATSVGDIPEILDHGRAGLLVEVRDPAALASALRSLITEPEEARRLGAAARARVESVYGRDRMVRTLQDIYLQALGSQPRSPYSM